MFDASLRPWINGPLNKAGRALASAGISANQVTGTGFFIGMLAVPLIGCGYFHCALVCILLNRLADGLDGAVARATRLSDRGGYLDIVLDFLFYSAVPFAFALHDPGSNALAACFVLFAFMGTGSAFLAFAVMAAKRGLETDAQGKKSFFYLQGLTEGFETILFLCLCVLLPSYFPYLALIYGCMCWVTTVTRIYSSYRMLD